MKTIEDFYKEWEYDKHYTGDENSWAIWFAEDWEKYKKEQLLIQRVGKSVFVVCENDDYGRDLWLCCKNTAEEAKEVKGRDATRNIYEHWIF